mmetsp:Transcript_24386/g.57655  ORF Transcript_24386/g.57655 Transcript_24386/m.57655 type:complete len:282 (+) Transcript_24386:828-1673(+)
MRLDELERIKHDLLSRALVDDLHLDDGDSREVCGERVLHGRLAQKKRPVQQLQDRRHLLDLGHQIQQLLVNGLLGGFDFGRACGLAARVATLLIELCLFVLKCLQLVLKRRLLGCVLFADCLAVLLCGIVGRGRLLVLGLNTWVPVQAHRRGEHDAVKRRELDLFPIRNHLAVDVRLPLASRQSQSLTLLFHSAMVGDDGERHGCDVSAWPKLGNVLPHDVVEAPVTETILIQVYKVWLLDILAKVRQVDTTARVLVLLASHHLGLLVSSRRAALARQLRV